MNRRQTPSYKLADVLIDGGLEAFVRTRRSEGMAWRTLAHAIWAETAGAVDITYETVRAWFPEDENGAAA